mmetsp:Transcript_39917/g.113210  ORF Transcript_39917/g.113210 Transcript_39917/m.113210 type:complete len:207 (+) Transcript_39917:69-689(+)
MRWHPAVHALLGAPSMHSMEITAKLSSSRSVMKTTGASVCWGFLAGAASHLLGTWMPAMVVRCRIRSPTCSTGSCVSGVASCASARLSVMRKSPSSQSCVYTRSWFLSSSSSCSSSRAAASAGSASLIWGVSLSHKKPSVMPRCRHMVGRPVLGCLYITGWTGPDWRPEHIQRRSHLERCSSGILSMTSARGKKVVAPFLGTECMW